MKYFEFLHQVQTRLEAINGFNHDLLITDFLAPSQNQNSLIVRENPEGPEVLVCLDEKILQKFSDIKLPQDFSLKNFADLSIVIEELSHFNTFCQKAMEDHPVSPLELEVQGEVDKFAMALDVLSERNEEALKHQFFEILFGQFMVGDWVNEKQRHVYEEAHQIARQFCRTVLERNLSASERRKEFRKFFGLPRAEKLSPLL